jgi:hypothetical protein
MRPGLFKELKNLLELNLEENPLEANLHEDTFMGHESPTTLYLFNTPLAKSGDCDAPIFARHLKSDVGIEFFNHSKSS